MSELALKLIADNKAAFALEDQSAKSLNLGNCGLTAIPEELFDCVWLEELVVSNEYWKRDIEDMEAGSWVISENTGEKNDISFIPEAINKLENLRVLVLEGEPNFKWEITTVPALVTLVNLHTLYLGHNRITDITPISGLTNLRYVYLSVNEISSSGRLFGLNHLEIAVLSHNKITSTDFLSRLPHLHALDLNFNQVTDIHSLVEFTGLTYLDLGSNSLVDINSMRQLSNLKVLFLSANQILDYTPLSALVGLESLKLSHNKLGEIDFLQPLTNLKSLFLSDNRIVDVMPLATLKDLQHLSLRGNLVVDSSALESLQLLADLDLSSNQLSKLPSLSGMVNLVSLNFEFNPITILSNLSGILALNNLRVLLLFGIKANNMHIPKELFGHSKGHNCLSELRGYFVSLRGGVVNIKEIPVILVGNSTAGKTSLRHFLQENVYPPENDHTTHGIESSIWHPDNDIARRLGLNSLQNTQFYFWDFGGQEYYHSTHRLFFSEKAIYILVWEQKTNRHGTELTDIKIVNAGGQVEYVKLPIESFSYEYWINSIRNEATEVKESPIFLLQNKIDEDFNSAIEDPDSDLVRSNNCRVLQVSVKNAFELQKNGERDPYFEIFLKQLFSASNDFRFKVTRSVTWEPIKEIIFMYRHEQIWTIEKFADKLLQHDLSIDEVEIQSHLRSLDALDIVLYDPQDPILGNYIFINPGWAIETIYSILDQSVLANKGAFDKVHVTTRIGKDNSEIFIQLMKRFELIFEDEEPDSFIAPQYLPTELSEKRKLRELEQKFDFQKPDFILKLTDFMPRYMMLRFVVAYGQRAVGKYYWKNGIAFTLESTDVLVTCNPYKNEFNVYTFGSSKRVQRLVLDKLINLCSNKTSIQISKDLVNYVSFTNLLRSFNYKYEILESEQGNAVQFSQFKHFFEEMNSIEKGAEVKIFISYAHADNEKGLVNLFEKELRGQLKAFEDDYDFKIFKDDQILLGEDWNEKLRQKVTTADIAILLLSSNFLQSEYINRNELALFLEDNSKGKRCIMAPIYFDPFRFDRYHILKKYQFFLPAGSEYGPKYAHLGNDLCYGDLVEFDPQSGLPLPNRDRSRYMMDFVDKLDLSLKASG